MPTKLEYIVEQHVTSTAQRETGISSSPIQLPNAFLLLPAVILFSFHKREQKNVS